VSSIEPACASDASETPITIRGTLPVKPVVSMSSSKESTVETGYRGWVGDVELTEVLWLDAATLTATVPAGIAAGVYALTIESPFGETSVLEGFRVSAGVCTPARALLALEAGAAPAAVRVGSTVVVSATVRNTGDAIAAGVTTSVVAPPGFALFTSPADPLDIAAGESRTFTWTYTAESGRGTFAVTATGVDLSSGDRTSAPTVNTNEVAVEQGAEGGVATFTVGGSVAGLTGSGLVLLLNGAIEVPVPAGATTFAFPALPNGTAYSVAVRSQPAAPTQVCSVTNGTGVINGADVDVTVSCVTRSFTVGGRLSGLVGNRVNLEVSYGDSSSSLSLEENGDFAFDAAVPSGSPFRVTVTSQPRRPTQVCSVENGAGTVAGADVTAVVVTCSNDDDD
jgi:hypothetical protein